MPWLSYRARVAEHGVQREHGNMNAVEAYL
jgi:hypothetical protein